MTALCVATAPSPSFADTNITENVTLTEDADWSEFGTVTVSEGVTVNLNGHALTVKGIDGPGAVIDIPGYQRLEYLQSSGTQWIDLGYMHDQNTVVDMQVQFTDLPASGGYYAYFGARDSGVDATEKKKAFGGWLNNSSGTTYFRASFTDSASNYTGLKVNTSSVYDLHFNKSGACTVTNLTSGGAKHTIGTGNGQTGSLGQNDHLFGFRQRNTSSGNPWVNNPFPSSLKVFYFRAYSGTTLIRDLVPVRRMSDKVLGMYDIENGTFYVNAGSGSFTAGPVLSKLRLRCGDSGYAYDFSTSTLEVDVGIPVSFMETGALAGDCDVRKFQSLEIESGATIDLAGHKLHVSGISGSGTITDSVGTELSRYDRLEYLQSSGTQWLDLGYMHDQNTVVDMQVQFTGLPSSNGYYAYFGSRTTYSSASAAEKDRAFGGWLNNSSGTTYFRASFTSSASNYTGLKVNTSTVYDLHFNKSGACTVTAGGTTYTIGTGSGQSGNVGQNDHLFGFRQRQSGGSWVDNPYPSKLKVFWFKAYSGTTLIRDMVPARRKADGVLGMLDLAQGKFYVNAGSGTFTAGPTVETVVAGGELHIDVAEGATSENSSVALRGCFKLVKDGGGTFVASKASQGYAGGTVANAGVVKCGVNGSTTLGAEGTEVLVASDATDGAAVLSMNGKSIYDSYRLVMDGGSIVNSGGDVASGTVQLGHATLAQDAEIGISNSYGFVGASHAATSIDLGGNELAVTVASGKSFWLDNTTVTNGDVVVSGAGTLAVVGTAVKAATANFDIGCALNIGVAMSVGDYVANYAGTANAGTAALNVNGTFKPVQSGFYGPTMQDGSTLDVSEWPAAFPVASTAAAGSTNISFAANSTITVRLGSRRASGRTPLVGWSSKPSNIDTVRFASAPGESRRAFVVKDDGLYALSGFVLIVK